jgi:Tfp pilus assembly protein PilF
MRLFRAAAVATIALCAFSLPLPAQITSGEFGSRISRRGRITISGTVRDANTERPLASVQVSLSGAGIGMSLSSITNSNGDFAFNDVRQGSYFLVVELSGYERLQEQIDSTVPPMGLQISLRPLRPGFEHVGSGPTVSVRELSIPRSARQAMERGLALLHQKSDYKGSLSQFQKAVHDYPDYYEAYAQMGVAYVKLDDPAKAEEMLRTSVDVSKHQYPEALYVLASLYSVQKRLADAEPLAREAVQISADSVPAHQELARALYGLDKYEEAEPVAMEAARLDAKIPQTYLLLADIHLKLQKYPEMIGDLDKYLELAPDGPQAEKARQVREQIQQALKSSESQ